MQFYDFSWLVSDCYNYIFGFLFEAPLICKWICNLEWKGGNIVSSFEDIIPPPFPYIIEIYCTSGPVLPSLFSVQFSSIQFSSVQISSVQTSPVQFRSWQYFYSHISLFISVQFNSVQLSSDQFSSIQFSSIQFSSIQFSSVQLFYAEENRPLILEWYFT